MKHFSRALVWLTISEIIFNLAGYVIHASLGRILGPEDYGRFGVVVTLTTMIIVLIGNGVPTAMSKYLAEVFDDHPERVKPIKQAAIWLQTSIMLPTTLVFYLLAPFIAETLLHDPTLTSLFRVSAFIIPGFALASFYFYYYTGLHFFRLQAFLKTSRALARIIFIIGFGYLWGVAGAVSGYIAAPLFVFALAFLYDILRVQPTLPKEASDFTFDKKTLLNYAWPFTLFLIFYELVLTADLYFVKALLHSDYLTGLYNATITVGRIPYYLFYALTIILLPAIAKTKKQKSLTESQALVTKTLLLMYIILAPMVTLLFAYSHQVIRFFYGAKYLEAIPSFEIFVFGAGLLTVFYVLAFALHGAGRVMIPMYLSLFGILLLAALNLTLIPRYGLSGAAWSVTLTSLFLAASVLVCIKKEFRLSLMPSHAAIALASSVAIAFFATLLPTSQLLFIPQCAVLFGLHLSFLYATKVLVPSDFITKK
jgi:stage V sporulation protein B